MNPPTQFPSHKLCDSNSTQQAYHSVTVNAIWIQDLNQIHWWTNIRQSGQLFQNSRLNPWPWWKQKCTYSNKKSHLYLLSFSGRSINKRVLSPFFHVCHTTSTRRQHCGSAKAFLRKRHKEHQSKHHLFIRHTFFQLKPDIHIYRSSLWSLFVACVAHIILHLLSTLFLYQLIPISNSYDPFGIVL